MPRWVSLLGDFIAATFLAICTVFFAGIALVGIFAGGWGYIIAAVSAVNAWILGICCKMVFQEWWEDK